MNDIGWCKLNYSVPLGGEIPTVHLTDECFYFPIHLFYLFLCKKRKNKGSPTWDETLADSQACSYPPEYDDELCLIL